MVTNQRYLINLIYSVGMFGCYFALLMSKNNIKHHGCVGDVLEWLVRLNLPDRLVAVSLYDSFMVQFYPTASHSAIEPTAMGVLLSQCRNPYFKMI